MNPDGIPPTAWKTLLPAGALYGLVLYVATPRWPDGWDGLGFLASVRRFDLDAFAPHPPGYPVYVALLRVAALLDADPMGAARIVVAASGAASLVLLAAALETLVAASPGASLVLAALALATPLGLRCSSAVGSEAPALALTLLAVVGLAKRSPAITGIGVGLALGVRASWMPLELPLLILSSRRPAAFAWATAFTMASAIPLALIVGPSHFAGLLATQAAGHFERWGGTVATEPHRLRYLARDLFVDGLGAGGDGMGVAIAVLLPVSAVLSLGAWRRSGWRGAWPAVGVSVPYGVWVGFGQNLREQPRHALPLVVAIACGLAVAAHRSRPLRWIYAPLAGLMLARGITDEIARWTTPPPGAALRTYIASLPDTDRVIVFGGASMRFLEGSPASSRIQLAETTGDVALALTRLPGGSGRVLVTGEVADLDAVSPKLLATFCRPARVDRKRPCLEIYEIDPSRIH